MHVIEYKTVVIDYASQAQDVLCHATAIRLSPADPTGRYPLASASAGSLESLMSLICRQIERVTVQFQT